MNLRASLSCHLNFEERLKQNELSEIAPSNPQLTTSESVLCESFENFPNCNIKWNQNQIKQQKKVKLSPLFSCLFEEQKVTQICKHGTCIKGEENFFLLPCSAYFMLNFRCCEPDMSCKTFLRNNSKEDGGRKNYSHWYNLVSELKKKHNKDLFRIILENAFFILPVDVLFKQKNAEKKSFSIIFAWKKFTYVFLFRFCVEWKTLW